MLLQSSTWEVLCPIVQIFFQVLKFSCLASEKCKSRHLLRPKPSQAWHPNKQASTSFFFWHFKHIILFMLIFSLESRYFRINSGNILIVSERHHWIFLQLDPKLWLLCFVSMYIFTLCLTLYMQVLIYIYRGNTF